MPIDTVSSNPAAPSGQPGSAPPGAPAPVADSRFGQALQSLLAPPTGKAAAATVVPPSGPASPSGATRGGRTSALEAVPTPPVPATPAAPPGAPAFPGSAAAQPAPSQPAPSQPMTAQLPSEPPAATPPPADPPGTQPDSPAAALLPRLAPPVPATASRAALKTAPRSPAAPSDDDSAASPAPATTVVPPPLVPAPMISAPPQPADAPVGNEPAWAPAGTGPAAAMPHPSPAGSGEAPAPTARLIAADLSVDPASPIPPADQLPPLLPPVAPVSLPDGPALSAPAAKPASTEAAGGVQAAPRGDGMPVAVAYTRSQLRAPQRLTVRLDPGELGRVNFDIRTQKDGSSDIRIAVERPETLALLRQDRHQLDAALGRAGLSADAGQVQLALGGSHDCAPPDQRSATPDPSATTGGTLWQSAPDQGGGSRGGHAPPRAQPLTADDGDWQGWSGVVAPPAPSIRTLSGGLAALDIVA